MSHHQAIKEKATELNNSQLHMFTDHVKVKNFDLEKTNLPFVQFAFSPGYRGWSLFLSADADEGRLH